MSYRSVIAVAALLMAGSCASQESVFTGYTNINDIRMYYELHGSGEPVLLLHGGTGRSYSWTKVIPTFAKKYQLIVPDSRAHGRTTDSDQLLGYDLMTDDVIELLDYLEIESAHVIGASDGGIIGLNLAMKFPTRVRKVVAYGANFDPGGLTDSAVEWIENVTPANYGDSDADVFYLSVAPDPSHFGLMLEKVTAMWLAEPRWTTDDLARISAPVFVIDDHPAPTIQTKHTREMAAAIPGARLAFIDDGNHFAYFDKPGQFSNLVLDFLTDE